SQSTGSSIRWQDTCVIISSTARQSRRDNGQGDGAGRRLSRPSLSNQNENRSPIWQTRCSGRRKSPEKLVGCSSAGTGAPDDGMNTRARNPLGLTVLNRLNISPIAST